MTKINPRISPRNIIDLLILIPAFMIQSTILFFIPMVFVWYISGNILLSFFYLFFVWLYYAFGGVRYLVVDDKGIEFKRIIGSPKYIHWIDLESVEVSSPFNTIMLGWLWPPIPAREMTYSLSTFEHIQFTYNKGKKVFFPPNNTSELIKIIELNRKNTLTKSST